MIASAFEPHPLMMLPFAVLLLAVALMPNLNGHWWERHYPKVAVVLGLITAVYYLAVVKQPARMLHVAHEYVSFMALIASLFVISGGIHIRVRGQATPLANGCFLLAGAVLANIVGTTGASMLLIRPWIRLNQNRIRPFHVVFFIFIVSNIGGSLTPIGDPPLFLGYLKGVPFWWVLNNCWPAWILGVGFLVATFVYLDWRNCSGHGCVLGGYVHHLPECFRRHRLYSFGVLLAKMVAQFVPCDAVAPPPKFLVGVAFEIFQTDGDGLQDFL